MVVSFLSPVITAVMLSKLAHFQRDLQALFLPCQIRMALTLVCFFSPFVLSPLWA